MSKNNKKNNPNNQKLPPLPRRAITGVPGSWVSSDGKPFHTVRIWEFTILYALLEYNIWKIISDFLKKHSNLTTLGRQLKISQRILYHIKDNPKRSIRIPNLLKLCRIMGLNLDVVEKSIQSVRFNHSGYLEYLSFPFDIDIYAWRAICHIAGDGCVDKHKGNPYPSLMWSQKHCNQQHMRELIKRLSRQTEGKGISIFFPKALTYNIMGTMPGITFRDLRTPRFVEFVIDLPASYRDWKVQFLAAFLVDDGCIRRSHGSVVITQKNKTTLEKILRLCDQLGYEHSPYPPYQWKNSACKISLYRAGIERLYTDLQNLCSRNPLLGLWHKSDDLQYIVSSFSKGRNVAKTICTMILTILRDHRIRKTNELHEHPLVQPLLKGKQRLYLYHRLYYLKSKGFIREVQTTQGSKSWYIPSSCDPKTLIMEFSSTYAKPRKKYNLI